MHGGGWTTGDKSAVDGLYDLIKVKMPDYAIANMNYRLTGTASNNTLEAQLEDIELLLADLELNKTSYQISDNYVLVGLSAGRHLALLYSYTKNQDNKIKAVGNIIGPTYFLDEAYTQATDIGLIFLVKSIELATGVAISNEAYYESISPYSVVDQMTTPTIQYFGALDTLVPQSQGLFLQTKLNDSNIPNELIYYPDEGHGWKDLNNWDDTFTKFLDFVGRFI